MKTFLALKTFYDIDSPSLETAFKTSDAFTGSTFAQQPKALPS